jgi:hypothetical protein
MRLAKRFVLVLLFGLAAMLAEGPAFGHGIDEYGEIPEYRLSTLLGPLAMGIALACLGLAIVIAVAPPARQREEYDMNNPSGSRPVGGGRPAEPSQASKTLFGGSRDNPTPPEPASPNAAKKNDMTMDDAVRNMQAVCAQISDMASKVTDMAKGVMDLAKSATDRLSEAQADLKREQDELREETETQKAAAREAEVRARNARADANAAEQDAERARTEASNLRGRVQSMHNIFAQVESAVQTGKEAAGDAVPQPPPPPASSGDGSRPLRPS